MPSDVIKQRTGSFRILWTSDVENREAITVHIRFSKKTTLGPSSLPFARLQVRESTYLFAKKLFPSFHIKYLIFFTCIRYTDKGGSLSKGSTAWTFGLFSDSPSHSSSHQRRQASTPSVGKSSKSKAASVAPSPELLHRSFTPSCFPSGHPLGLPLPSSTGGAGGFFGRNERRTRSLERCSQQRVRSSCVAPGGLSSSGSGGGYGSAAAPAKPPPPIPSRVRSRSLEKNYQISTTAPYQRSGTTTATTTTGTTAIHSATSGSVGTAANNSSNTPLLPIRRNNVPPEVLATWCTFNEAFGGGRPKHQHRIPAEPLTFNDE